MDAPRLVLQVHAKALKRAEPRAAPGHQLVVAQQQEAARFPADKPHLLSLTWHSKERARVTVDSRPTVYEYYEWACWEFEARPGNDSCH